MIEKEVLEKKKEKLIQSLKAFDGRLEDHIDHFVNYLQHYTDQRKKPTEPHGLDVWAHEALGLEAKEYDEEQRKVLREIYSQVETFVLNETKIYIEKVIKTGEKQYVEDLLARQLKDELKVYFCEIIAREVVARFNDVVITLFLKGTRKVSIAALTCMKSLKHYHFYFPVKTLQPSRVAIALQDKEEAIKEITNSNPLISSFELSEDLSYWHDVLSNRNPEEIISVIIAIPYERQQKLLEYLDAEMHPLFENIGNEIEKIYGSIGLTKTGDYLNELKKALLSTMAIGQWKLTKQTEKAVIRHMLLEKDYTYLSSIVLHLNREYRDQYFTSILNPPKHVKSEYEKNRLLWVFNQIRQKFQDDFMEFERIIKWHIGNEDPQIKIETLLLLANMNPKADSDIAAQLKEASSDNQFVEYFDRINLALSGVSLAISYHDLQILSQDAISSKVSAAINKGHSAILQEYLKTISDFFAKEMLLEKQASFLFSQLERMMDLVSGQDKLELNKYVFDTFNKILASGSDENISVKQDLILNNEAYIQYHVDSFPGLLQAFSEDLRCELIGRILYQRENIDDAVKLSVDLATRYKDWLENIFSKLTERIIKENINLADITRSTSEVNNILILFIDYLSIVKRRLLNSQQELHSVNELMKKVIIGEIIPKLEKAQRRAGSHQIFTENYNNIIQVLSEYVSGPPAEDMSIPKGEDRYGSILESNKDLPITYTREDLKLSDTLMQINSLPPKRREAVFTEILDKKSDDIDNFFNHAFEVLPSPMLSWLYYRILDYSLDKQSFKNKLVKGDFKGFNYSSIWSSVNQMLYRLHHNLQETIHQREIVKQNQLKEIGRLISDQIDKIEINLFGYHELRESLARIGLERVVNEPGKVIDRNDFDGILYESLPSDKQPRSFQVITLGLKIKNGELIKRAYLEPKDS